MKRALQLRKEFSEAFGVEMNDQVSVLDEDAFHLNYKLMQEENEEYLEACEQQDLEQIADAIGDQLYILMGMILQHGLHDLMEEVYVEIHRSNMSKLDKDGKPIINGENGIHDETKPLGKVLKGDGYTPPNIDAILQKYFEGELAKKFLDEELKDLLDENTKKREELLKEIIQEHLSEDDWKQFQEFERLADYFAEKVKIKQERFNYDLTRFGVEIDGEDHWIAEKSEESYDEPEEETTDQDV